MRMCPSNNVYQHLILCITLAGVSSLFCCDVFLVRMATGQVVAGYLSGCHLPTAVLPTSINTTQLSSGQHRNTAATQPSFYSDVKNDNSSRVDEAGRVDDPLELPGSVAPLPHLGNNMHLCRNVVFTHWTLELETMVYEVFTVPREGLY